MNDRLIIYLETYSSDFSRKKKILKPALQIIPFEKLVWCLKSELFSGSGEASLDTHRSQGDEGKN